MNSSLIEKSIQVRIEKVLEQDYNSDDSFMYARLLSIVKCDTTPIYTMKYDAKNKQNKSSKRIASQYHSVFVFGSFFGSDCFCIMCKDAQSAKKLLSVEGLNRVYVGAKLIIREPIPLQDRYGTLEQISTRYPLILADSIREQQILIPEVREADWYHFNLNDTSLKVRGIYITQACSGYICNRSATCSCLKKEPGVGYVVSFQVQLLSSITEFDDDVWVDVQLHSLSKYLVHSNVLKDGIKDEQLSELRKSVVSNLLRVKWDISGWYKISTVTVDNITSSNIIIHIVQLEPSSVDGQFVQFKIDNSVKVTSTLNGNVQSAENQNNTNGSSAGSSSSNVDSGSSSSSTNQITPVNVTTNVVVPDDIDFSE